MASVDSLAVLVQRWLDIDRDPSTRKEIEDLLHAGNDAELNRRLRKRIAFGTAGLRSSMKAGFAHMNAVTVIQASQGLADYVLKSHKPAQPAQLAIVIGYDARHNSEKFARLAAAAVLAKGFRVLWFGRLVHTPLVPFAVKLYKSAAAGVMVTASHNPKADNGYKVYWENGSQIIPPHDTGIAAEIDRQSEILSWNENTVNVHAGVENVFEEAERLYCNALRTLVPTALQTVPSGTPFIYTPMHGVGLPFVQKALHVCGMAADTMRAVPSQSNPDPDFPTVAFPNPEENGALDMALSEAEGNSVNLVLANDPDADRFAAAERRRNGSWHQFTGNQMGVLLASYVLETSSVPREKMVMLASTVSSRMLASMAAKEGFHYKETLTGFKWLGNIAQDVQGEDLTPVFAYEEAIGYMFPSIVFDKDGIAAAAVFLLAYNKWHEQGLTASEKLQRLYEQYGYFEDANTYLISPTPEVTTSTFAKIRTSNVGRRPDRLGQRKILRWRDLTVGFDSAAKDGKPDLPVDSSAQMVTCWLEDDVVFTARGSGTEPKIKLYIEAKSSSSDGAKQVANAVLQDLVREWFGGLRLAGT